MATTMAVDEDDNKVDGDETTGDDNGNGKMGDDNHDDGDDAMGNNTTGYDIDDDCNGQQQ